MGEEPDDDGALTGAQTAVRTRHGVVPLSRADYHPMACGSVDGVGAVPWYDDDDGPAVCRFQFVGVGKGVRRQIDRETVAIRVADACTIACGQRAVSQNRLVGVGPAAFSVIGFDQLGQCTGIDYVSRAGQIARLVVPPKLACREGRD